MKNTVKPVSVKRNLLVLLVSCAVGAFGIYSARHWLQGELETLRAANQKDETMVSVVVPGRAMIQGETIGTNDLLVREVPANYVDSNTVTEANFETALGQKLSFDIDRGSPLLWAHLEGGRTPTFSGKVPQGMRAMTVRVDEINAISGFLQPGDRIDLLLAVTHSREEIIKPVIQNLAVIATGEQTVIDKSYQGGRRVFNTITVQVTPEQAQVITLSQQLGRLTALLRNPEDDGPLDGVQVTRAALLGLKPAPAPVKAKPKPRVIKKPAIEYIIGGT